MPYRSVHYLSLLTIVGVTLLSVVWEFALEPLIGPHLIPGFEEEPLEERWEFVITATISAAIALIIPIFMLSRIENERNRVNAELRLSEERYRTLYDINPSMIFTIDVDGTILSVNDSGADQLGYDVEELVGTSLSVLQDKEDSDSFIEQVKRCLQDPSGVHHVEFPMVRKDGSHLWAKHSTRQIKNNPDKLAVLLVSEDISDARKLSERLSYEASHDPLTGLANRRELERRLDRALASVREARTEHALCFVDLDQFKVINDTCGHVAGDEVLCQLGNVLRTGVRRHDTLARIGGDEFVALLEDCPLERAERVAYGLLEAVEDFRFLWSDRSFSLGVSIGLVPITTESGNSAAVLSAADAACYAAKNRGRNRIHVHYSDGAEATHHHE